ncbi:Ras-like GTP-binding protein Rho1 [Histomonas meleagridis]|uniref:Ras-like GTP-binding protein Rho1 n=1 Tax=Histomonas meleagridis TaxID=135588 RepID=UPI0035598126|nr:Ras-like GTP-binding protein Rho1 [Histomonas meleagridis]KAH0798002.1 Ras-like GTP-binding protein Rho1 [Histomonas meleagridis]
MLIKCVVIGDKDIGKTELAYVYKNHELNHDYNKRKVTIVENYQIETNFNKHDIKINVCDTSGQEEYDRLRPISYSGADVLIVCFSLFSPESFRNVDEMWLKDIREYCKGVPYILAGLKNDLIDNISSEEIITRQQGEAMKEKIGAYGYIECSVDKYTSVNEVFELAIRAVIAKKEKKSKGCEIY